MTAPSEQGPGMPDPLDVEITELVERNRKARIKQGSHAEYRCVADAIRRHRPGHVLIFGVGRDSHIWQQANRGGTTVYLEHEPRWIEAARRAVPECEIYPVHYETRRYRWRRLLEEPGALRTIELPARVDSIKWDVIFVDSPQGSRPWHAGRMQSIYTAAELARRSHGTDVLVHDCDRRVERSYCDRFLGDEHLVAEVRKLRHYRL